MVFGSEMSKDNNTQIIRNDHRPLNFRNMVNIETSTDNIGALSSIPPRVLTVQDITSCYQYKIGEIGHFEIRTAYEKLCIDEILKDEFKIIVDKGFTHALDFPKFLKNEWIKMVFCRVHDMKLRLEGRPIKINEEII